jgi:hypothetical protein
MVKLNFWMSCVESLLQSGQQFQDYAVGKHGAAASSCCLKHIYNTHNGLYVVQGVRRHR